MSRFVRASKYRHVFGQQGKKYGFDNVKVTNSAWYTNVISASNSHRPMLDTDWSPFNDSIVASAGENGKAMSWKVDSMRSTFGVWTVGSPRTLTPSSTVPPRCVGHVLNATSTGDHHVKRWDLANSESPKSVLGGHTHTPTRTLSRALFSTRGASSSPPPAAIARSASSTRAGSNPVRGGEGHGGVKGARLVWMGDKDRLATTGFSKMSDRQVAIWETGSLANVKTLTIDQTSVVLMPFWTDNNILFLAGKGDGNIHYYEYEHENLFPLAEYKSSDPQRGMCFLPRRGLSVSDCEIARALKVAASSIEAIAFIVPRKAESFQSDIYPPALSAEPALSAAEFFSGKTAPPKLVSLDDGSVFSASGSASVTTPAEAPAPTPAPTKTTSAPPPAAAPAPIVAVHEEPAPTPRAEPTRSQTIPHDDSTVSALKEENARLNAELREARTQIRNLELQVETVRANARKAVALLES
ncbi:DUF1900-domain-containing protein [Lentinus tigrinus ALCF2SS1-7]|uniref:DUF1900-domain-containing protein n=1 Tax=Lentinus tigrinus ALCF2SS1-6 TaxID=1328759 RepID=A0A5C2RL15_9APHY|nr:DUF1900-domain-containing protein [Lentinus tigrinus ALCF2SS1-6]RPD73037.1 DUF1900-domain-containing protein [Lentinus tigrinus ALCF2SS1-7]